VSRLPITLLSADPDAPFPPASRALREPDGLLAAGGDLHPRRLLNAYRQGIFPWYSEGQPILWWSPDPRSIFATDRLLLSRKFRRLLRRSTWRVRADTCFALVMRACAEAPRPGQDGTWITEAMLAAYGELHRLGHAHSVEVFAGERLVGGLYGVAIGQMFFGESMFSGESGSSKLALATLALRLREWGWPWIDAQVENEHTRSLGTLRMPRERFLKLVSDQTSLPEPATSWTERFGELAAAHLAG
jgi:leucyl/phenylalanyl-tRNA--protein transferase